MGNFQVYEVGVCGCLQPYDELMISSRGNFHIGLDGVSLEVFDRSEEVTVERETVLIGA
jgi:hypothetical protein